MVAWLEESGKLCRKALNRKVATRWTEGGGEEEAQGQRPG